MTKYIDDESDDDTMLDDMHYLHEAVEKFIREHNITCGETIFQCDRIGEASLELIYELCEIVGYVKPVEEDE